MEQFKKSNVKGMPVSYLVLCVYRVVVEMPLCKKNANSEIESRVKSIRYHRIIAGIFKPSIPNNYFFISCKGA